MPPTVKVKSSDEATRLNREEAAQRVVGYFGNRLPDLPLLCFFDDEDWPEYKGPGMAANRGIYFHDPPWMNAPDYVRECVFTDGLPFTNLIYLHGSACAGTMGLTMTFAHELQHFVQHSARNMGRKHGGLRYSAKP